MNRGRLDLVFHFNDNVYILEFKVVYISSKGSAIDQLREKRYANNNKDSGESIYLVGTEFSKKTRRVVAFEHDLV